MSGDRFVTRVNEMAGPYQMFAELCDLVVFEADEATCALEKRQSKKGGKKRKKRNQCLPNITKKCLFHLCQHLFPNIYTRANS